MGRCSLHFIILTFSLMRCKPPDGCEEFDENSASRAMRMMKYGKFEYLDEYSSSNSFFVMNDSIAKEVIGPEQYVESRVKWVGPFNYELTVLRLNIPDARIKIGDLMKVAIMKIDGNIIYYQSVMHGETKCARIRKIE